jgi:glyoxylase-like metal-dependent hydrolase (beta-lactamase superfamily II)
MENLVTITVNSTHFYLIDYGKGKLLFDVGWANLIPKFLNQLKVNKIELAEIKYIMFSHNHPDHADLVQTIKRLSGARLLIQASQIPFLSDLADYSKNNPAFEPVVVEKADIVSPDSRTLHAIGIAGEIVETPGHSDDSISLVLDSGLAFIGDLPLPGYAKPENGQAVRESWARLAAHGAQTIYPGHANPFQLSELNLD